jgi:flagellar M-ring protein FliF
MNFFQKIGVIWQKISLVQRALLIAVVLTFIIAAALLTRWASRPDMRMLYHELAPEEASKITEKISEKGVAYELRNGGTTIYVPKEKVYQLRLDMAKEGLPVGEQGGYKIFDSEKIGISPFVQNVNLKRALQEELAKSIQMIDGVAYARVHIVSTERTLFTSQAGQTSASVVLRLKPGYQLSSLNIAAVTHLVAGSVEGLKSENVTVIDSQGRLLSGESDQIMASGAGTVADYKERVEQNLASKVVDMLTAVLGPGRAAVKVSAVIDMNSTNIVTERYEPKGVPLKEEIKSGSEIGASTASAKDEPAIPGSTKKDETISTEYQYGKTVKQEVVLPGKITSLTVAAIVDLSPSDVNTAEEAAEVEKVMKLPDVEKLIENALGLNLEGADSLKVVEAKFYRPIESLVEEEPSNWPRYIAIARQVSLGVMAVCALLVLRIFSGAKKKRALMTPSGQLPEGGEAIGLLPSGAENSESLMLRRKIAGALHNNPEQAKQLFSNWLEEKGE